jgi:hypothetical protein
VLQEGRDVLHCVLVHSAQCPLAQVAEVGRSTALLSVSSSWPGGIGSRSKTSSPAPVMVERHPDVAGAREDAQARPGRVRQRQRTSHELRFFSARGEQLFAHDASLESLAIEQARGTLRHASWRTREEWNGYLKAYRYAKQDPARFQEDLVDLARGGRRLYVGIARELSGGPEGRATLEESRRCRVGCR